MTKTISGGVAHKLPAALRKALAADPEARAAWEEITPLSRNEWICWTISVKTPGKRQDKALSPSQQFILGRRSSK